MTEAEARIFLGYEPEDELEDVIEELRSKHLKDKEEMFI
jgi:hypothetical protein